MQGPSAKSPAKYPAVSSCTEEPCIWQARFSAELRLLGSGTVKPTIRWPPKAAVHERHLHAACPASLGKAWCKLAGTSGSVRLNCSPQSIIQQIHNHLDLAIAPIPNSISAIGCHNNWVSIPPTETAAPPQVPRSSECQSPSLRPPKRHAWHSFWRWPSCMAMGTFRVPSPMEKKGAPLRSQDTSGCPTGFESVGRLGTSKRRHLTAKG